MRSREVLTICDNKEVDAKDGKAFSDLVMAVLEFSLHDSSVYFDYDNTTQTSKNHAGNTFRECTQKGTGQDLLSTAPLVSQVLRGDCIGEECDCAVYARQGKDFVRSYAKRFVQYSFRKSVMLLIRIRNHTLIVLK